MTAEPGSLPTGAAAPERAVRRRHYLMCPPTYFEVRYRLNPWMDPSVPVDRDRALAQWSTLVAAYAAAGHQVDLLDPLPGLPDMVFAANGATVLPGRGRGSVVYGAAFASPLRQPEAAAHAAWHSRAIRDRRGALHAPRAVNEGEGDFAVLADRVLAGHGFRTTTAAHAELADLTGREVISLRLVDPRFYHLDTALTVLDDHTDRVAYYPPAFAEASRRTLKRLFPDAVVVGGADAYALGLNCVSDGHHVFVPAGAEAFATRLAYEGFVPVPVDLSELILGGGAVKCCTQEIR
ncbi:MAG: dimethylargininase, partial [Actinomycetes bacterium]